MNDFTMMMSFSFTPQTPEIRTMLDRDGNPWFVAKDVCDILGLTNPTMAIQALDDDERAKSDLGRQGETNLISESGLFTLIVRSDKPEAKPFRKWVTSEVLPSIRKHGFYGMTANVTIPEEPQQAYALWPHLDKQYQFHLSRAKALRDSIRQCLAIMKQAAPLHIVEPDKQLGLQM